MLYPPSCRGEIDWAFSRMKSCVHVESACISGKAAKLLGTLISKMREKIHGLAIIQTSGHAALSEGGSQERRELERHVESKGTPYRSSNWPRAACVMM